MAEKKAPGELTIYDLGELSRSMGKEEKGLMKELLSSSIPRQGMVLADIFHHFPGTVLVDKVKRVNHPR